MVFWSLCEPYLGRHLATFELKIQGVLTRGVPVYCTDALLINLPHQPLGIPPAHLPQILFVLLNPQSFLVLSSTFPNTIRAKLKLSLNQSTEAQWSINCSSGSFQGPVRVRLAWFPEWSFSQPLSLSLWEFLWSKRELHFIRPISELHVCLIDLLRNNSIMCELVLATKLYE